MSGPRFLGMLPLILFGLVVWSAALLFLAWQLWIAEGGYCGNDESQGSCGLPPGLYFSSESQHGPWTPHPDGSDEDFYHPNLPGGYWYLFTDINYRTLTLTSAPADWQ